jgi:hypothetical protein
MPLPGTFAKVVLVFQDTDNDIGWSEAYYAPIPGAPAPAAGWQAVLNTSLLPFYTARLGILVTASRLDFIKISDDNFKGDMATLNVGGSPGTFPPASNQLGGPLDAALVQMGDITGKYNGRKFYHGFPVNSFTGRQYTPTPAMVGAFLTYRNAIAASGLCIKAITKPVAIPPVINYFPIAEAQVIRLTGHRVGRPFDYLRGRRRIA